ncbi:hypothetical protein J3F83DRAFT_721348 [Trichoderma novae-zelandiae]
MYFVHFILTVLAHVHDAASLPSFESSLYGAALSLSIHPDAIPCLIFNHTPPSLRPHSCLLFSSFPLLFLCFFLPYSISPTSSSLSLNPLPLRLLPCTWLFAPLPSTANRELETTEA